jgi:hypothetical protein
MGTITRSFANNLTTGGVLKADAFNNASLNNVTALNAAIATGNMILLSSQTASDSASISLLLLVLILLIKSISFGLLIYTQPQVMGYFNLI